MVQLKGIALRHRLRAARDRRHHRSRSKLVFGSLRVGEEEEIEGLDLAEHSESAYGFAGGSVAPELTTMGSRSAISMAHPAHERVA